MLGLEYALQVFGVSKADLAKELGIDRSNLTMWFTSIRPIPKKYLPRLAQKFNIPEMYLSKEIGDIEKLEIQNIKFSNDYEYVQVENSLIDENGEVVNYISDELVNDSLEFIETNKANIEYLKSIKRLQMTLNLDPSESVGNKINAIKDNTKLISLFAEIMKSEKVNKHKIEKMLNAILIHLEERTGFGKLYDYQDDKFVIQLVKLLDRGQEIKGLKKVVASDMKVLYDDRQPKKSKKQLLIEGGE